MRDRFFRYPKIAISFLLVAIGLTFVLESLAKAEEVVNLYTSRHYESDSRLYALFEVQTGIKVNVTSAKGGALIEKIQQEGELTPGDVFITSDVGNLWRAESQDLFLPISSSILDNAISDNLRSPNGTWYGLAKRARVIYYHPARVTDEELNNPIDLNELYASIQRNGALHIKQPRHPVELVLSPGNRPSAKH